MSLIDQLNERHIDVLKEIGNIGAGNAATALSNMLLKPIDMEVPYVRMVSFNEMTHFIGGPEHTVTAVYFRVEGDVSGSLFFMMELSAVHTLLKDLVGISSLAHDDSASFPDYSEMEGSAINEVGNIMAGSYLSSLADLTHLTLVPSVPSLATDMAGAILSYGLVQVSEYGDAALVIDTNFIQGNKKLEGRFFFIPDPDSLSNLFRSLGVSLNDGD